MAQYFTDDFSDFSTDWTERIKTGRGWGVTSGNLDYASSGGGAGDWVILSWNDVDDGNQDDVEVLYQYVTPSNLSSARYQMVVRASGADESVTCYSIRIASSTLRVYYNVGTDSPTQISSASYNYTFNTSSTYWIRARFNGDSIKVRVWTGTIGDEPTSSWFIDTTDSLISAAGWVGPAEYSTTSSQSAQLLLFGVGTNGDTAPSSTSSGTSVTPDVGTISITGYNPTVAQSANQGVTPDVGNITITGYAPTVARTDNQAVAPGVGSVTITGYAPTVTQGAGQQVNPAVGNLTITGYAPTVSRTANQEVLPSQGSLTITGYAPTVAQSGGQNIVPVQGVLVFTGYPPTVAQTQNNAVQPAVGAMVITGYQPTVEQTAGTNIRPDAGQVTITGYAPTVARTLANNVNPTTGQLAITGYAPSVVRTTGGGGGLSASDVWSYEIESGKTAEELMRLMAAVLLGKTTVTDLGGGVAEVTFEAANGTKVRVTATMTNSERTSVSFDETF